MKQQNIVGIGIVIAILLFALVCCLFMFQLLSKLQRKKQLP